MKAGLTFAGFLKVIRQCCEVIRMRIGRKKVEPNILWLRDYIREVKAIDLVTLEVVWSINGHIEWAQVFFQHFYQDCTEFGNLFCR